MGSLCNALVRRAVHEAYALPLLAAGHDASRDDPGCAKKLFRTRQALQEYTLESLLDLKLRRELVQQMSSATSAIPGSVGERRNMRQELEAMVHQVEAETADLGMNGGAGRIPSGFCTLICAVYKWAQLHETV